MIKQEELKKKTVVEQMATKTLVWILWGGGLL